MKLNLLGECFSWLEETEQCEELLEKQRAQSQGGAFSDAGAGGSSNLTGNRIHASAHAALRKKSVSKKRVRRFHRQAIVASLLCLHFFLVASPSLPMSSTSTPLDSGPSSQSYSAVVDPIRVYSPPKNNTMTVAICLIVKNETVYMDEWVDYHIALGVR
mmetsp:Transcript_20360/g.43637  ORF Transcript_20360/g.43637 Transcript_20360/m.43637 type:complete len:159 (+) Transcript_20360:231-707(+)